MTRFLMIRHGQSATNNVGVFSGHLDSQLSELGLQQAHLTAEFICANYQVDAVYASDLVRASVTGKCLADKLGIPMIHDQQLREINGGLWENIPYVKLLEMYPESYGIWKTDIGNAVCDGGESVAHLQKRILDALRRIAQENDGKTVAVATHATPIRATQCYCQGKSLGEMKDIPWVSNASVTVVCYDGGRFTITDIGLDAHLGELTSQLGKNV